MINKVVAFSLLVTLSSFSFANETVDKPKIKEVCKDVVKNGKTTKECKKIKIHKKLDGTKVPPEKKNG